MKKTKNLGLNITDMTKDGNEFFNFDSDLGYNFNILDEQTITHRHVTNCLLEVPQNINLELSNGTLTLKKGSKLYKPNGVGVFEEITIIADVLRSDFDTSSNKMVLFYSTASNTIGWYTLGSNIYSGTVAPTGLTSQSNVWFDTVNNLIKTTADSGVTWVNSALTLPFAIVTRTNGVVTSIDQIFNCFGFMGSSIWVSKGVKFLIPDGKNTDGSLKNITHTKENITVHDCGVGSYNWFLMHGTGQTYRNSAANYHFVQDNMPVVTEAFATWYSPAQNILYRKSDSGAWVKASLAIVANYSTVNSVVSSFNARKTFQGVDFYDYQLKIKELEAKISSLVTAVETLQAGV